jgi:holo-[acyl-carrier protein] synthase
MIIAVGTDIVEVARIRRAVDDARYGARFRQRVFTAAEIAYCTRGRGYAESFAARFAAKEAVMKVLGRGFGDGIGWHEIEVRRDGGRPELRLCGLAAARAAEIGATHWHLSLSHTTVSAVAFVVAEGGNLEC